MRKEVIIVVGVDGGTRITQNDLGWQCAGSTTQDEAKETNKRIDRYRKQEIQRRGL